MISYLGESQKSDWRYFGIFSIGKWIISYFYRVGAMTQYIYGNMSADKYSDESSSPGYFCTQDKTDILNARIEKLIQSKRLENNNHTFKFII